MGETGRRLGRGLAVLLASVLLAASAQAGEVRGKGVIVERQLASGLLRLQGGETLQVTERTRIVDEQGRRLAFGELPVAGTGADGRGLVAYRGTDGAVPELIEVRLLPVPAR